MKLAYWNREVIWDQVINPLVSLFPTILVPPILRKLGQKITVKGDEIDT